MFQYSVDVDTIQMYVCTIVFFFVCFFIHTPSTKIWVDRHYRVEREGMTRVSFFLDIYNKISNLWMEIRISACSFFSLAGCMRMGIKQARVGQVGR